MLSFLTVTYSHHYLGYCLYGRDSIRVTDLQEMKLALEVFVKTKKGEKRENFYVFLKVSLLLVTLAWMVKGDPLSTLSPGVS